MGSLRTVVGIVVLSAIAYGVYVSITKTPTSGVKQEIAPTWSASPQGDLVGASTPQFAGSSMLPPGGTAPITGLAPAGPGAPTGAPPLGGPPPINIAMPTPPPGAAAPPAMSLPGVSITPGVPATTTAPASSSAPSTASTASAPAGTNPPTPAVSPYPSMSMPDVPSRMATPTPITATTPTRPTTPSTPVVAAESSTAPAAPTNILRSPGAATTDPAPAGPAAAAAEASAKSAQPTTPGARDEFVTFMQAAQASLNAGRLDEAQLAMSAYYNHSKLSADESRQLNDLLDRVAGTLIYSRQHLLEPAYKVQPGDTLDRIAQSYNVSPELLAKINGVRDPKILQPGQELKVVRGPFDAIVDLGHLELALFLKGRYAGRFAIGVGRDYPPSEGSYTVRDKKLNPTFFGPDRTIDANDPTNPLGKHWLDLGSRVAIHGTDNAKNVGRADGRGCICLGDRDIGDVFDILSVGSNVVIRR